MLDRVISVSLGEVALKGLNRSYFENQLIRRMKGAIKDLGRFRVYKEQGKIYVELQNADEDAVIRRLRKVFGIVYISPCYRITKDINDIKEYSIIAVREAMENRPVKTFKVHAKRADKRFPLKSMEINNEIGGTILREVEDIKVDVHNPDLFLYIDIRENCYIYTERFKAYGGLPIGTNGKAMLLLSGGIDSPVAGFMMAKRGVEVGAVYYHSYPFTSERADEKVKSLGKILARYCGKIKLYSINILDIQKEISKKCPEDEMTIITRRFMMRIAERIANDEGADALITGESLGQVASQTIKGLNATNSSVNITVFRPLIGMDKVEIIEIAKDIETFETSILPYEDCCTVFLPKHPVTRPKLEDIENSEKSLDVKQLIEAVLQKMEVFELEP